MMDFLKVRVSVLPAMYVNTEKPEEERWPIHCVTAQGHPNPCSVPGGGGASGYFCLDHFFIRKAGERRHVLITLTQREVQFINTYYEISDTDVEQRTHKDVDRPFCRYVIF